METSELQVPDDFNLLDQMVKDESEAPQLFRATNYWFNQEGKFLAELHKYGLREFRCRRNSILSSFGATDLRPIPQFDRRLINKLLRLIDKYLMPWIATLNIYKKRRQSVFNSYVKTAQAFGENKGAYPLSEFSATLVGYPEEIYQDGTNIYTIQHLNYYLQYAYCSQFIDFDSVSCIVELGSGSGKQIEIIKRLHPHITFLLFDIAPQLYVCEQYLKTLFPEFVVSYKNTKDMKFIPEERSGKIFIFGAYKFPIITNTNIDLFWNSASFQEMEPEVVENYIGYVKSCSKYIYLRERIDGKEVADRKGSPGVLNKVTLKDYLAFLSGFRLIDICRAKSVDWSDLAYEAYYDCIWKRDV